MRYHYESFPLRSTLWCIRLAKPAVIAATSLVALTACGGGESKRSPSLIAITPTVATVNTATLFAISGQDLPLTAVFSIDDATCQTPSNRTASGFSVVCTLSGMAGSKTATLSTDIGISGGAVIDASKTVTATSSGTATNALTDTGITAAQCYQAGSDAFVSCTDSVAMALSDKQDGMLGRDVSNADNSDGKLGFSYSSVGSYDKTECVKDNITGLTWEGKPTSGPRDANIQYYGGISDYVADVNAAALCGFSDWRLPTIRELQSLVDYSVTDSGASIDTNWFPNQAAEGYASATLYANNTSETYVDTWYVSFSGGFINHSSKNFLHVRLVR